MIDRLSHDTSGQAALAAVVLFFSIAIIVGGSFTSVALRHTGSSGTSLQSLQSFMVAESGVEDAIYRTKTGKQLSSQEIITLGGATAITSIVTSVNSRQITGDAFLGSIRHKMQATVSNVIGVDMPYGVQIGTGGIEMDNNSRIQGIGGAVGNVFSLGDIEGDSGATITGNVTVSGTIDDVIVHGDVRARTINRDTKVCGNAYYGSINSTALNFLNNPTSPTCPSPLTAGTAYPNQAPSTTIQLPIEDNTIDDWKEEAGSNTYSGSYSLSNNATLGPVTITGSLNMTTNNKILTVAGTIYVRGNIDMSGNGVSIQCASSYGPNSCTIIADGWIRIQNNGAFSGSGTAGSYLLILTTASCNGTSTSIPPCNTAEGYSAINLHNNATGAIFYASNGKAYLHNNVNVTEIVARTLELDNNATISYELGASSPDFSAGPSGSWDITDWREIE